MKPRTSWWRPPSTRPRSARATMRPAAGPAHHARQQPAQHAPRAAVLHAGQDARQIPGQGARERGHHFLAGQEVADQPGDIQPSEQAADLLAGDHVAGEEAAKRLAEPRLFVGDDGGVGDRQAQRMAEQGGDREPVRDAPRTRPWRRPAAARSNRCGAGRSCPASGRPSAPAGRWRRRGGAPACGAPARLGRYRVACLADVRAAAVGWPAYLLASAIRPFA